MSRRICVIGTGYVGTACALGLAELGWDVVGYDMEPTRIKDFQAGRTPYYEDGIADFLRRHLASGKLHFTSDHDKAVAHADTIIVCVGTPSGLDGSADVSALHLCVRRLLQAQLAPDVTVVIRSTVPPGTGDAIAAQLGHKADVISAPEFLREGSALHDFLNADRHLIGAEKHHVAMRYSELFAKVPAPILVTKRVDAEIAKLASNAYLAMKISFANEIANLSDAFDANAANVLHAVGLDKRIGQAFLQPGIGFGGPCFEKDLKNYRKIAEHVDVAARLVTATLAVNTHQPRHIVNKLERAMQSLQGTLIGVWGLTFKAGTSDMRGSLVGGILEALVARGATVKVFDPVVKTADLCEGCTIVDSELSAADADALLVLTEWPCFTHVDPAALAVSLRRKIVVDGRNHLHGQALADLGVTYIGVGQSYMPTLVEAVQ